MITLIIKLIIAHVLGDFVMQPNSWVKSKQSKRLKSKYFYLHGLVHLIALLILLEFNGTYWPYITMIVISHLIVDFFKLKLSEKYSERLLFTLDQILHLSVICGVVYILFPFEIDFERIYAPKSLLLLLAILSISFVSSIIMKVIMSKWNLGEDKTEGSLDGAGKYIGILERLFVFGFILLNQWGAIGLLITAKSVFRFSDLTRAKDRKLTEYILIGTLISFGMAISVGLMYQYFQGLL